MSKKSVTPTKKLARYEPDTVYIGSGSYVAECVRADDGDYYLAADVDAAIEALQAEVEVLKAENARLAAVNKIDEVVFIDGVGAARSSIKSCHNGVQWIKVGDRVYWPLSDSDAKRLHSACCGNGSFDGPTTPAGEGEQQ